ncbi:autotransporter outer membrane beta-barrel domain-containing protein [Cetobacterium sp.]
MRIYSKKYLFIGILASIVTACGSGGGGGSSSNSPSATSSPTVNSKTNTNIVPPINPKIEQVNVEKPIPEPEDLPPIEGPTSKNSGTINVIEMGRAGLVATPNKVAINEKSSTIKILADEGIGIVAFDKNAKAINNGTIITNMENPNTYITLMKALDGGILENNGKLKAEGTDIIGMLSSSKGQGFTATNNGEIEISGNKKTNAAYGQLIGMRAEKIVEKDGVDEDIHLINNGKISIDGNDFHLLNPNKPYILEGMSITAFDSKSKNIIENKGTISVSGKKATGMNSYGENTTAINRGTINVKGEDAIGMNALRGAVATNEKEGVINVQGFNSYGMVARLGGKIINKGKIVLAGDSPIITGMFASHEGSSIVNEGEIVFLNDGTGRTAIQATNGATYINKGKILANNSLEISTDKLGKFIIGKDASGNIAKVKAKKSLKIDGDIVATNELIDGNKREIIYNDVFSAPTIDLSKSSVSRAVSVFYNSKLNLNGSGNVDMTVYRNDTSIEEIYKSAEFSSLTDALDRYLDIEKTTFSKDEKLVVDKILKSSNVTNVKKVVKDLSGQIYANLPRQIFDIQTRFVKEDEKLIDNLNEHSYNFNFFGDKSSVKDKGEISGYKSISEGFVGTKRLTDDIFTTIGYQNSHVKYNDNSKGSIQSIHTGIYKKFLLNNFNIKLGLNGEYNFHETNREIDIFNKKAKAKYNSYTFGANGEISKLYGDSMYFKPMAGLNLGYGKYKKFTEKNVGDLGVTLNAEDYFSILPSVGFKVGKNFDFIDLYSNIVYSYELGELNKKQGMSLLGDKVSYKLKNDSLEKENLVLNVGLTTEIKDFKVSFEIGKEFGKRDNNYLSLGVGYKF